MFTSRARRPRTVHCMAPKRPKRRTRSRSSGALPVATPPSPQYLLRLDDDVTVKHANRGALGTQPKMGGDLFARMHRDNVTLGWFQGVVPFRNSGGKGVYRDMAAFACSPQRRFPASPLYGARPALTGGCYEMYHLSVYQNQHYMDFVGFMRVWYWVASFWHEQVRVGGALPRCPARPCRGMEQAFAWWRGAQGGFLMRSLVDGAGSYSVAHRVGLLPTELTGMWGWILVRPPPAPAPTKQMEPMEGKGPREGQRMAIGQ